MSLTTPTVPRTLLEAVNELLRTIRVGSVNSLLSADLNEDASAAKEALDAASIEVQQEGWAFNHEAEYPIDPDVDGSITLPSNTLKVHSAWIKTHPDDRLVERGGRLYHPKRRTFNIGKTVYVDITLAFEFSDLPQHARSYITAVAASKYCPPRLPSGATFRYTDAFLEKARGLFVGADEEIANTTLKETNPHFANMTRR